MPRIHRLSENDRSHTDKDPNLARASDGTLWVAWQSYRMKEDRILCRAVARGRRGPIVEVSDEPGVNFQPRLAGDDAGGVWVAWSAQRHGRWCILARRLGRDGASPVVRVSDGADLEVWPAIAADGRGGILVAWSSLSGGRRRILGRRCRDGAWSDIVPLAGGRDEHFRPVLCSCGRSAWIAWETRRGADYTVHLARWTGRGTSRPVRLKLTDAWEMFPRLCADGCGGVWAAWIATHDVASPKGCVDHKVEALAAHWDGAHLTPYRGPDRTKPDGYVTHLYDGLLGRNWYMGFVGWRRRPQLVRDAGGDVWLLYERKADERVNRHGPDALLRARPLTGKGRGRTYDAGARGHAATVCADIPADDDGALPYVAQISEGRYYADVFASALHLDRSRPAKERPASRWRHWRPLRRGESRSGRRPTMRVGGKTYRLYWGDPHCHGCLSGDAEGEVDENYAYGRYRSGLDFMAVTENDVIYDNMLTPSEWDVIRREARHHDRPGHFVAYSAYERTCREETAARVDVATPTVGAPRGGLNHRIVLFPGDEGPLYHFTEPDANTPGKWVAAINATDAFAFPHHATWRAMPGERLDGAEVCSCWDVYIKLCETIPDHFRQGYRFALMGNSDSHRVVPGCGGALTGVWAEELTRASILEALRARRCVATNGERVVLNVRANGAPIGSETPSGPVVRLQCAAAAPRPIEAIVLRRDGQPVHTLRCRGRSVRQRFQDRPGPGTHFYYVEVQLRPLPRKPMGARCGNLQVARGDLAWSSPIWVDVGAGDPA